MTTHAPSRPSCGCGSSSAGAPRPPPARRAPELPDAVRELVDEAAAVLSTARREQIVGLILRDTVGLGPLEELLADDEVEEVMVNGHESVYVERRGRIERDRRFASSPSRRCATRSSGSSRRSGAAWTSSTRWPTRGSPMARASTS